MTSVSTDRRFGVNAGMAIKVPCKVATTANITLSGEQTIDGVACVEDDRVLVRTQTTASENGIYYVKSSAWERTPDFDDPKDVSEGTLIPINQGSTYTEAVFRVDTTGTIIPGTTSITFTLSSFFADRQAPISNISSLRNVDISGLSSGTSFYVVSHTSYGDGGHGDFRLVTGAAAGTYTDNNGTIIVPTGGDGSSAFLRQYEASVDVKWFGAAGASVDYTTHIQEAINYCIANTESLFFPNGTYLVSADLDLSGSGIEVVGESMRDTIIKATNGAPINFGIFYAATGSSNISIRKLQIDGNSTNNSTGLFGAILITESQYIDIRECYIKNTPKSGVELFSNTVPNIWVNIDYCQFENLGWRGIDAKYCVITKITNNDFWKTGSTSISLEHGDTAASHSGRGIIVVGNTIDRGTSPSVVLTGQVEDGFFIGFDVSTSDLVIDSNYCNNNRNTANGDGIGLGQDGTNQASNVVISNNVVKFAKGFGIDAPSNSTVTGNVVLYAGLNGIVIGDDLGGDISNVSLSNNVIVNANYSNELVSEVYGISVYALVAGSNMDNINISGNVVIDTFSPKRISSALNINTTNMTLTNLTAKNNNFNHYLVRPIKLVATNYSNLDIELNSGAIHTIQASADAMHPFETTEMDGSINVIASTLGNGQYIGQFKKIVCTDATNNPVVTLTNHITYTTATFTAANQYALFMWTGAKWVTIAGTAVFA